QGVQRLDEVQVDVVHVVDYQDRKGSVSRLHWSESAVVPTVEDNPFRTAEGVSGATGRRPE
ncbi:hypothetical protein, partial [Streptomyces viridochromogenes]|uniref:hypothetical protein n=1 Tax=Streptomyces viridochromogenes TaxID=1938 RepID=UPI001C4F5DF8